MRARAIGVAGVSVALLFAAPARAVTLDPNFVEGVVATTIDDADLTSLAWAPDGSQRLFVTRKGGQVYIIENGVRREEPFAEFLPIYDGSECGLLAIAFDPDYGTNGFVYFFVSVSPTEQQIIRLRDAGNVGVDKTILVSGLPTAGANHDGGALGFGPDGKLYWAIGDNGNAVLVRGDTTTMKAKVGRANRDGTLPEDNPFDDGSGPNADFAWARGFRNPFTMTFQPTTGLLWLNVVGTYYEQVFVVRRGDDAGWPDVEHLAPSGVIRPVIRYRTNDTDRYNITAAERSSGVATFTISPESDLLIGDTMTIAGVGDSSFDGIVYVRELLPPNGFRAAQAGPDATSSGGTASTDAIGGCITGGVFDDTTAATGDYRGSFFFGDFNTGLIRRATVDGSTVTALHPFSAGHDGLVDIDTGPDGALYWVRHNGNGDVYRSSFVRSAQGLVVSRANVRMLERGVAAFNVRLALAPASPIVVSVARTSGDPDVSVMEGSSLTFGTADWATPRVVRLAAALDADTTDDLARVRVSAAGLTEEVVTVRVTDEVGDAGGAGGAGGEGTGASGGEGGAGTPPRGGSNGSGGTSGAGAAGQAGEEGGAGEGGASGEAGASGDAGEPGDAADDSDSSGCGCTVKNRQSGFSLLLAFGALFLRRRVRARR